MKVTIDTKEDSYEDMAKILHILTNILEKKGTAAGEPVDTTNLMGMFSGSSPAEKKEVPDKAPDFGSFLNLTNKGDEKKEEKLEIEYF